MQRPAQHLAAEIVPVRACVDEMQVPGFVDSDGGRHFAPGGATEVEELPVFLDDAERVVAAPVIVARESR